MKKISLFIKRCFDLIGSTCGLLLVSPILVITAVIIKISMPGPVFFKQERVGKNGRLFNILKFRSLKVDKEAEENHDFSRDEERKTSFGNLIRRFKIDELPQLLNVLMGDMSLVSTKPA